MDIESIFQEELARALKIIPPSKWVHAFKELKISKSKRAYGTANTRGIIQISQVFRNTGQQRELRDTIRHEFAHLVVGIAQGHSNTWIAMAKHLGCTGKRQTTATGNLKTNMRHQWRLMAETITGRTVRLQSSHNRMSKYLRHEPAKQGHYTTSDGEKIAKFYYVRNK